MLWFLRVHFYLLYKRTRRKWDAVFYLSVVLSVVLFAISLLLEGLFAVNLLIAMGNKSKVFAYSFVFFISVGLVYLICWRNDAYKEAENYLESLPKVKRKRVVLLYSLGIFVFTIGIPQLALWSLYFSTRI